ncbi:MAG: rhomboid family intramembrane serine protease [Bacteroidia bacterium]
MIPIGDDKLHGARTPFLCWIFIAVNVFAFFHELSMSDEELNAFILEYGVIPVDILNGENYKSLITSMFLHGGWMHLIGNMLFLYVFGDNIEAVKGHAGFLVFYILGGLAGSFAHIFFSPESTIPSIGASGAISALLGAYLVWFPGSKIKMLVPIIFFITFRVNAFIFLFIWAAMQLFYGMASIGAESAQTAGVAYWAHIGGFAFGLLVAGIFRITNPQMGNFKRV